MLIELGVVEQRHKAVLEVMGGLPVTEVARSYGVTRQTVHRWLRRYARGGIAGLADGSSPPGDLPAPDAARGRGAHRRAALEHPGWGPRTLRHYLAREELSPLPGRSSIYRCLVRHRLIEPQKRRRKREDYRRWERPRAMELWQMDVMGGVRLAGGRELKIVTGIDDHSRFCVCAHAHAHGPPRGRSARRFLAAMRRHGVPEQILTDNGKVFTARFGRGKGEVLFDRICRENGIRHLLTAPAQPDDHRQGRALPQDGARRVPRRAASSPRSRRPRPSSTPGSRTTTPSVPTRASAWWRRCGASSSPAQAPRAGRAARGARPRRTPPELRPLTRLVERAGTHQLRGARATTSAPGSPARRSSSACATASSRSPTAACSSPATRGAAPPRPSAGADRPAAAAAAPAPPLASGPAVMRKVDPTGYVSFAGTRLLRRATACAASRSRCASSATRCEISQRGELLKTHAGAGTTAARSTAPSRRRKDDRTAATPPGSQGKRVEHTYRSQCWNAGGGT